MLLKRLITHNWMLKLFSLVLASLMWFAISSENNLEISLSVPLGYQGHPPSTEITHESDKQVTLRLRGSASVLAELSTADVTVAVSLAGEAPGSKNILLSPTEHVQKPFGVEVLRIEPNRVRFDLERTITKAVPIRPLIEGAPAEGFVLGDVLVNPGSVELTGPESSLEPLQSISTLSVRIDGARESIRTSVDLDLRDPLVGLPSLAPVAVEIEIAEIEAQARYRVPLDPEAQDLWRVAPASVEIRVAGPASLIDSFDASGLYFTFPAPEPGSAAGLAPRIIGLPASFRVLEINPESVEVSPRA
jgi:YbbR domain-containing protein